MSDSEAVESNSGSTSVQEITVETTISQDPVYANHVIVVGMPHEAVFDFFEVVPAGPNEGLSLHVSRVLMPLSLLKGFHGALGDQIASYESGGRVLPNLRKAD